DQDGEVIGGGGAQNPVRRSKAKRLKGVEGIGPGDGPVFAGRDQAIAEKGRGQERTGGAAVAGRPIGEVFTGVDLPAFSDLDGESQTVGHAIDVGAVRLRIGPTPAR